MTYETTYPAQRSSGRGVFVFIILVLGVILAVGINILPGKHAMESHPDTAPLTRD